jgi:hypothetical protein
MRKQFIECKTRRTALRRCPWACIAAKLDGGFMVFESVTDYLIWKNQK